MRRRYFRSMLKRIIMSNVFNYNLYPSGCTQLIGLVLLCTMASLSLADDDKSVLSVPQGWRVENTTYPPPWAKSLPWKGKIELRFPPGFFKPTSPYFWTYPILYKLQGKCITNDIELKRALLDYDAGLYGETYSRKLINITIQKLKVTRQDQPKVLTFKGFDPFTTKKPLTTYLEIQRKYHPVTDTTTILILRSARPIDKEDSVWRTLYQFRKDAGF
jgi:hypothetical protein